jgi:hypothetical protein
LLAIHKEHNFDPTIGKFGIPRGDYEKIASEVLYNYGRKIILGSENTKYGVKASEGTLDGILFDIKGVEGTGKNNIINHFKDVSKKDAEIIVFYYHDKHLFDNDQLKSGHRSYQRNSKSCRIKTVYYIVDGKLYLL